LIWSLFEKSMWYDAPQYALLDPSVISSLLGPCIHQDILIPYTFHLCSSLKVRD
jgi:hypothetical protein